MEIYYLAHPVRNDAAYKEEENLAHVLEVQKILFRSDVHTIIPWYTYIINNPNCRDFRLIERCLDMDCRIVERCDGIILTGHRLSHGMEREYLHAKSVGVDILDLVGVPDRELGKAITEIRELFDAPYEIN